MSSLRAAVWHILGSLLLLMCEPVCAEVPKQPEWAGQGALRILIEVPARQLDARTADELPAEVELKLAGELSKLGIEQRADLSTFQVMQYDPVTGKPLKYDRWAYRHGPHDRPFRWYDDAIPFEFPDFRDAVSRTKERIVRRSRTRGGAFYNVLGDWKAGRLVWSHTQHGKQPSYYAIYFDLLDNGTRPSRLPPAGWVGDGSPRRDLNSTSTMGADHCRVDLDDWNGDGLVDLIVGEHYGHLVWWPNLGTATAPEYRYAKLIFADGAPLDSGMAAAPKVVDWDGDGALDLLVGCHWNRILFYRNTGTNVDRQFAYQGPLKMDGQPLEVPIRPLTRGRPEIFKRDYYPVLDTVDWDGDGDLDLLAGGYVTGMIFFYENVAQKRGRVPELKLRGPLHADGKPLNVGYWCAAPCAFDLDDDGDLDLISGNMPMYLSAEERGEGRRDALRFYENVGSRAQPDLRSAPLPADGRFTAGFLATPRAADWDGDGDQDLVVSSGRNVFLFANQGTPKSAQFALHNQSISCPWGLASINTRRFLDWDDDGRLDLVNGYVVRLNTGKGNPFAWDRASSILPAGKHIEHPSGIGDDWFWPYVYDFDGDGKRDVLFGDWYGHIWLHRNLTAGPEPRFDYEGFRFCLESGERIKVGPINKDVTSSFSALQGARTVFAVSDLNGDGRNDLIVGDTFGKIRYFEQRKAVDSKPRFAAPVEVGDLGIRGLVDTTDWDADGRLDIVGSAANGRVRVFLNQLKDDVMVFSEGIDPGLPLIEQPRVIIGDLNGDGDADLFLPSTQGSCLVERSFLNGGYARANMQRVERRDARKRGK